MPAYSPGGTLNAFAAPRRGSPPHGKCPSFTARTTRVSNPVRSPRFRASASVCRLHAASAIGVLRHIYAFHRYMTRSACTATTPAPQSRRRTGVEPRSLTAGLKGHPLSPMIPDNARILRITAAAGTELADACSCGTLSWPRVASLLPHQRSLQPIGPSSSTRLGWFSPSAIDQYSSLLPPVGVWPVSQCQCGGPSSQNP